MDELFYKNVIKMVKDLKYEAVDNDYYTENYEEDVRNYVENLLFDLIEEVKEEY